MTAEVIDYRVSRIVVLCKDCGQDVGLYPARHKCGTPSSETPPLPSIPKKYLSAGKTTDNSENSKLWNKFLRATAINNNADYDSDNESEKEEWEGETHISRILREYYENKGVDLPDWLYDLDSTTFVSNIDNNIDRGRQLSKSQTLMNYPPPPNSFNGLTTPTLPKNMDQRRYNDRSVNNTLILGGQPFPNVRSTSDDYGSSSLMSKKSYQQLRTKSGGHISTNPSSRSDQHFIPRDIRRFNYNSNPYESDGHGRQEAPPSGPRGPSRNNRKAGFF